MGSTAPASLEYKKILSIKQQSQRIIGSKPSDSRLEDADLAIFASDSVASTEFYHFKETCEVCKSNQLVPSRNQE